MGGCTDGRMYGNSLVLQDIGPLGPLPKKDKDGDRQKIRIIEVESIEALCSACDRRKTFLSHMENGMKSDCSHHGDV